jgi:hypothetical protein
MKTRKKRNGASTLQRVLARMQMGRRSFNCTHRFVRCEQFAFKGFPPVTPLAQSWMEVPLMGIVGVIYCWLDS